MKVLMLSSRIPYPLTAGFRIRIYNEAKHFHDIGAKVDLLYIGSLNDYENYKEALSNVFDEIMVVPTKKLEIAMNLFSALLTKEPFQVALYRNKQFERILKKIEKKYDLIIGNHIRTTEYLKSYDKEKVIIDLHDAISYNYSNLIKNTVGLKRLIYKTEFKRVLKYEKSVCEIFKKLVIVSEKDKQWLSKNGVDTSRITVIPVAVRDDITDFKTNYTYDQDIICFLGKMSYQPNEDAVVWFADKVMPKLEDKYPNIIFCILGIEPTDSVKALASKDPHIQVTGFVENPYSVMVQAKATVVPIRNGAGVQNKVLESMFVGTPVVASEIAAEGILAANDVQILIAKDENEFFECLCRLLDSSEERRRIGEAGRKYITENFTWDSLWDKWYKLAFEVG